MRVNGELWSEQPMFALATVERALVEATPGSIDGSRCGRSLTGFGRSAGLNQRRRDLKAELMGSRNIACVPR